MAMGKKTGGRQKGTPNKRTAEKMALVDQATTSGISPLEVMLGAMREAWAQDDKEAAANFAKDAAPYVHPRLSAVDYTEKKKEASDYTADELFAIARMGRAGTAAEDSGERELDRLQ